ncbi:hypothetical protein BGZ83_008533 [Gryganskiella cystojenkinii]|nr:hypothetical protein BGZ83_008533 [Gryganskiella cystojenkinii]
MELHSLFGQHPGSSAIDSILKELGTRIHSNQQVPLPIVKVYKDAVYFSYKSLGISFNYEPSQPLVPSQYTSGKVPELSLLTLVAIHLYKSPTDQFSTFPSSFLIPKTASSTTTAAAGVSTGGSVAVVVELDMSKKAHEIVQAMGEPEEKQGGGRAGNCWIGYQKSSGFAVDFAGANWDDRDMTIASVTLSRPGDCR